MPIGNHNVPSFNSVEDLRTTLEDRDQRVVTDLYPRDGTKQLANAEDAFAKLVGVEPEQLLLTSSGMSALAAVFEQSITPGAYVAAAWQTYSQTSVLLDELCKRSGARLVRFDSGNPDETRELLGRCLPDVLFTETVSNGPDTPVADVTSIIDDCHHLGKAPTLVVDNTLPLQTGYATHALPDYDNLIVVESATKAYAQNRELAGLIYASNPDIIAKLRGARATYGFCPNLGALAVIEEALPDTKAAFDERNRRTFRATEALAQAVHAAIGASSDFFVTHPSLPHHPNHTFAAEHLNHGSSPVFYIQCTGTTDQFELADQLWQNTDIREQTELGQSFGFDHTRILPNATYPVVRIAGGYDTETDQLGEAFFETLTSSKEGGSCLI